MKYTFLEMIGKKYGMLTVKEVFYKPNSSKVYARSICDCGNEHEGLAGSILKGSTKSCGCLQKNESYRKLKDEDVVAGVNEYGVSGYARKMGVSRELVYKELRRAKNEGKVGSERKE